MAEFQRNDVYSPLERGIQTLLEYMGANHPRHQEVLTYEQRLSMNIDKARRLGDTADRSTERAEITDQLQPISFSVAGVSFNELCKNAPARPRQRQTSTPATKNSMTSLINTLAELYPSRQESYRIVEHANVPRTHIAFQDKAVDNWYAILHEARKHSKVRAIIEAALEDYPDNSSLREALPQW
jgi:hypothetical protein